jgi:hypothetical protein
LSLEAYVSEQPAASDDHQQDQPEQYFDDPHPPGQMFTSLQMSIIVYLNLLIKAPKVEYAKNSSPRPRWVPTKAMRFGVRALLP